MNRLLYILALAAAVSARPGRFSPATNKLSLASWGSYNHREHKGPGTYAYGYDIEDPVTGNVQFRQEERHLNGTITGSYGYVDANGVPQVTHYISDINGFRIVANEPGTSVKAGEHAPYDDNRVFASVPFDNRKTDRIYNPPPLIYELAVDAPFLNHNRRNLVPLPFLYGRK